MRAPRSRGSSTGTQESQARGRTTLLPVPRSRIGRIVWGFGAGAGWCYPRNMGSHFGVQIFPPPTPGILERIRARCTVNERGCWLWQGAKSWGYGRMKVMGTMQQVHRVAWEAVNGPVPPGKELDHFVCDARSCANPSHCRSVTGRENTLRGDTIPAKNAAKTCCPKCGGAYTERKNGHRWCRRCGNARQRNSAPPLVRLRGARND